LVGEFVSGWLTLADDVDTPLDPRDIDPGTSVLIAGPALTGKRDLMFDIVGGSNDETACLVTTKKSARRMREWFAATVEDPEGWELTLVDCVGRRGGFSRQREATDVRYVSSPRDLTGIGIELTGYLKEIYESGPDDARIGLHSLSTLLMYGNLQSVFRFSHVMTSRTETADVVSAFTLDTTSRNAETVDTLSGVFDTLVEVREDEDGKQLRVRGDSFGPRSWTYFD
jgi:hypothetical protein